MVLAHVRHPEPRGHVPVDVAHVVVRLVLAQVGQVVARSEQEAPVVAVQGAVEPAQHAPLQPLQQPLGVDRRGRRRLGHGGHAAQPHCNGAPVDAPAAPGARIAPEPPQPRPASGFAGGLSRADNAAISWSAVTFSASA